MIVCPFDPIVVLNPCKAGFHINSYFELLTASKAYFSLLKFSGDGCCPNIIYWFTLTSNIFSHSWRNHFLHVFKKMTLFLWNRSAAEKKVGKHYFLLKNAFAHFVAGSFRLQWVQGHWKLNFLEDLYVFIVIYVGMPLGEGAGLWKMTSAPMQNRAFILCPALKFQPINLLICFHSQMKKKKKSLRICTDSRLTESQTEKESSGERRKPHRFSVPLLGSPLQSYCRSPGKCDAVLRSIDTEMQVPCRGGTAQGD